MKQSKRIINISIVLMLAICLITTGINAANLVGADSVQYKDTTVKAALDDLMDKTNKYQDIELITKVKIGDYVKMIPTSTSYTVSGTSTTINPSELNLWRVIAINEDGTIDMVSEYVSSTAVTFYGKAGYLNLVGALNTIAKQYENSKFTVGSRHMGYNGQTETITDTSKFTTTAPWTYNTKDNSNEAQGGGDIMYEKDTELVSIALGTLSAYKVGTTTATTYWLASRYYVYSTYGICNNGYCDSYHSYGWSGRYMNIGSVDVWSLYNYNSERHQFSSSSNSYAIRPIVTLKSGVLALGSGTIDEPWTLG